MKICFVCKQPCKPNDRCKNCGSDPYKRRLILKDRIQARVLSKAIKSENNKFFIYDLWNGKKFVGIGLSEEAARTSLQEQIFGYLAQGRDHKVNQAQIEEI